MIYGYVRVSTREQNEDRQMLALNEKAVPEQNKTSSPARILSVLCTTGCSRN